QCALDPEARRTLDGCRGSTAGRHGRGVLRPDRAPAPTANLQATVRDWGKSPGGRSNKRSPGDFPQLILSISRRTRAAAMSGRFASHRAANLQAIARQTDLREIDVNRRAASARRLAG